MKHCLLVLALLIFAAPAVATAEQPQSWIFHRSYYSHEPVQRVELTRRSTGGPFFSQPQGGYIRGGWRWNRSTIYGGPGVVDTTNIYEGWGQTGRQF